MDPELLDKYSEEWAMNARENLAYVVQMCEVPFIDLDHPDADGQTFFDHVDEIAEELFIEKASSQLQPLDNRDYLEIAKKLSERCRKWEEG